MRLILTVFILFPGTTWAQSNSLFKMPLAGQSVPAKIKVDPVTKKGHLVWVGAKGFKPRYEWKPGGATAFGKKADFMQPFYLIEDYQDPNSSASYSLLGTQKGSGDVDEIFGWVDNEVIVESIQALLHPGTRLYLKLRVINSPQFLGGLKNDPASRASLQDVTTLRGPYPGAEKGDSFKVSNLFFVYAKTADYYLVGVGPTFTAGNPTQVIEGWVPRDRSLEWDSRMALEWNRENTLNSIPASDRRTKKGVVIVDESRVKANGMQLTREYLAGKLRGESLQKHVGFPEEFDETGASVAMDPSDPRMPVISEKTIDSVTKNAIFPVGWASGKIGTLDRKELERKLLAARSTNRKLDLMVVIDKTGSMEIHFPTVARVFARIYQQVYELVSSGEHAADVQIAICFYSDVEEARATGQPAFEFSKFVSLTADLNAGNFDRTEQARLLSEYLKQFAESTGQPNLPKKPSKSDFFLNNPPPPNVVEHPVLKMIQNLYNKSGFGGGGAAEDVFLGIKFGLGQPDLRPDAHKVVILMGDMGDKSSEGESDADGSGKITTLRDEIVSRLLPPGVLPHSLVVIHTFDSKQEVHPDVVLFQIQFKYIVGRMNDQTGAGQLETSRARFLKPDDQEEIESIITNKFGQMLSQSMQIEQEILELIKGKWNRTIGAGLKQILIDAGLTEETLEMLASSSAEVYAPGYVLEFHPEESGRKRQVRTRVMMTALEIAEIRKSLDSLVGEGIQTNIPDTTFAGLMKHVIENATEGSESNKSYSDIFLSRLRIPAQSALMRKTPEQLRSVPPTETDLRELQQKLQRLNDLLNDHNEANPDGYSVVYDQGYHWESTRNSAGGIVDVYKGIGAPKKVKRWFTMLTEDKKSGDQQQTRWYWLDLETEIP